MVEWKYALDTTGGQCVMMDGMEEMQPLCVDNWKSRVTTLNIQKFTLNY